MSKTIEINTETAAIEIRELSDIEVQQASGAMPSLSDIGDFFSAPGRAVARAGNRYANWVNSLF